MNALKRNTGLALTAVISAILPGLESHAGEAIAQSSPDLVGQAEVRVQAPMRLKRPPEAPIRLTPGQPFNLNAAKFHLETDDEGGQTLESLVPSPSQAFPAPALGGRADFTPDERRPPFNLAGRQNGLRGNVEIEVLSKYDVELIVDESLSMMKRDCPGGLSRWDWCGVQARHLSQLLAPLVPSGLTLSTFASNYKVYENSKPNDIIDLFATPFFAPGTRLSRPLEDRLGTYFRNRRTGGKPLVICVITDGVPAPKRSEPYRVAETLVAATKQMKDPREVTVVFFQVGGNDRRGQEFLQQMDHDLTRYGARFDFVKSVTFEQLMRDGLARSLVASIKECARRTN